MNLPGRGPYTKTFPSTLLWLCVLISLALASTVTPRAQLKEKQIVLDPISLQGGEAAMHGPETEILASVGQGGAIWVTGVEVDLVDVQTRKNEQEYVCHAHLGVAGPDFYKDLRFFGFQNAGTQVSFPSGFAVPLEVSPDKPLRFYGQVADYAKRGLPKTLQYQCRIQYFEEEDALRLGIKKLDFQGVWATHAHNPAVRKASHEKANASNFHWLVPPGVHEFRSPLIFVRKPKADIQVHHMHTHLHAYARYGEIYDRTLQKTVWRGKAFTYDDKPLLEQIEHYSDSQGFTLYQDHQYELVAVYDNPTSEDVDAMFNLRMAYAPHSDDPEIQYEERTPIEIDPFCGSQESR